MAALIRLSESVNCTSPPGFTKKWTTVIIFAGVVPRYPY